MSRTRNTRRRLRRRRGVRLGLVSIDQALSSLTNIALSLAVAHAVSSRAFGAFAASTLAYVICLGLNRALCCEPLVIRYTEAHHRDHRRATARAAGASFCFSLVAGAACVVIGLAGGPALRGAFIALGVMMPGLLVQDVWRFSFFAEARPARAVANDGLWALVEGAGLVYLLVADRGGVVAYIVVWGIAAYAGAVLGVVQAAVLPRARAGREWLREHGSLLGGLAADFVLLTVAGYVSVAVLAFSAGFRELGAYRAAEVLMGPVSTMIAAGRVIALTELVRTLRWRAQRLTLVAMVFSLALGLLSLVWLAVVVALPDRIGTKLLGETWTSARSTVPFVALAFLAVALNVGPLAGMRALQAAKALVRWRIVVSLLTVTLGTIGALAAQAKGTAIGLAAAAGIGTVVWWIVFVRQQGVAHPGRSSAGAVRLDPAGGAVSASSAG